MNSALIERMGHAYQAARQAGQAERTAMFAAVADALGDPETEAEALTYMAGVRRERDRCAALVAYLEDDPKLGLSDLKHRIRYPEGDR